MHIRHESIVFHGLGCAGRYKRWLHDMAHLLLHSWQLVKRSGVLPLLLPYGARDSICSALCLTVKEAFLDYKN